MSNDYPMYVICPVCGHSVTFGTPYTIWVACPICGTRVDRGGDIVIWPPPEDDVPRRCIIATVFLGEQHPFLPPMRKFRDKFISKSIMEIYYSSSVFVLRKIRRLPPCQR